MLATLELLPMWSGVDPDVELFASGDVAEEDDEWKGGHSLDGSAAPAPDAGRHLCARASRRARSRMHVEQSLGIVGYTRDSHKGIVHNRHEGSLHRACIHYLRASANLCDPAKPHGNAACAGAEGGSSGAAGADVKAPGMRLCLSQIREWVVEYSADTLFYFHAHKRRVVPPHNVRHTVPYCCRTTSLIASCHHRAVHSEYANQQVTAAHDLTIPPNSSINSNADEFVVCRPTETYAPWFYMVLKAARVAVTILQMLANEVRLWPMCSLLTLPVIGYRRGDAC